MWIQTRCLEQIQHLHFGRYADWQLSSEDATFDYGSCIYVRHYRRWWTQCRFRWSWGRLFEMGGTDAHYQSVERAPRVALSKSDVWIQLYFRLVMKRIIDLDLSTWWASHHLLEWLFPCYYSTKLGSKQQGLSFLGNLLGFEEACSKCISYQRIRHWTGIIMSSWHLEQNPESYPLYLCLDNQIGDSTSCSLWAPRRTSLLLFELSFDFSKRCFALPVSRNRCLQPFRFKLFLHRVADCRYYPHFRFWVHASLQDWFSQMISDFVKWLECWSGSQRRLGHGLISIFFQVLGDIFHL